MKEQLVRLAVLGAMTAYFLQATMESEATSTSWIVNTVLSFLGFAMCISELSFVWKRLFYLPPGSIGYIPLLGEMIDLLLSPPNFFLSRVKQFGSPFLTHVLFNPTVNLTTSEDLTWLWNAERKGHVKVGWPSHLVRIMGPGSVVMADGTFHRSLRRLLEPAFAPTSVGSYVDIMDETIQEFLNDLYQQQQQQQQGDGGSSLLLSSTDFKYLALKIFCFTVFGKDIPDSTIRQLNVELKKIVYGITSVFPIAIPGTNYHACLQSRYKSIATIQTLISDFKNKYNETSPQATQTLMGRLCYGRDDNEPLSTLVLSENLLTILIGGHDTTYATIGTIMHHLSSHPNVVHALEQEVQDFLLKKRKVKNNDNDNNTFSSCLDYTALKDELPILNAIIAEAWRIDPPSMFGVKKVIQTISHKNYTFHEGSKLCYNIFLGCRDQDLYPNPQEFRIERFLPPNHPHVVAKTRGRNENAEYYYKGIEITQKKQCYPVFNGGNHSCLGSHFAWLEMRIFLLRLVQRYSVDVKKSVHYPMPVNTWQCDFTLKEKNSH